MVTLSAPVEPAIFGTQRAMGSIPSRAKSFFVFLAFRFCWPDGAGGSIWFGGVLLYWNCTIGMTLSAGSVDVTYEKHEEIL